MIPNRHRQRGAALLLVSAALFSGGLGLVLHEPAKIRNDNRQMHILKIAKTALIARAATDDNRPGSLPCPDLATDSSGLAKRHWLAPLGDTQHATAPRRGRRNALVCHRPGIAR